MTAETGWIYRKYFATHGPGLGAYGVDYVFNGAQVIYSANVAPGSIKIDAQGNAYDACAGFFFTTCPYVQEWYAKHSQVWANIANVGRVLQHTEGESNGNIAFKLEINQDRNSINDIKGQIDQMVRDAGFDLRASQIYFISNPRRDDQQQPPVNTPGVDPRYTQKPPQSLVDTPKPKENILDSLLKSLRLPSFGALTDQEKILLGGAGLILVSMLLRRR